MVSTGRLVDNVLTHVDYTLYCEADEPARDSSRSGYKGDLLDIRSGRVYGGMGVGMFWGQQHAKFPRLTEAAKDIWDPFVSSAKRANFF